MKPSRVFAICCFVILMTVSILFAANLTVWAPTVSCSEYANYKDNYYLGYYQASDVVHIYQQVWNGNNVHIDTIPADYYLSSTTSRDSQGSMQRKVGVIAIGELKNSAGNTLTSLSQVDYIEDIGSWIPGWPWFSDPPVETTSVTAYTINWTTSQAESCTLEGEGTSTYVAGGTSLSISGWGFTIGSGNSSYTTTGTEASNSTAFEVIERDRTIY